MATLSEFENSKISISEDLEQLALLLNQYNLCKDTERLYSASKKIKYDIGDNTTWKYSIGLQFSIPTLPSHIRPPELEFLEVYFTIDIDGNILTESIIDPINNLEFNISITGLSNTGENVAYWHLDKHVGEVDDGITKFIHPEYHLSFGGNKLWDERRDYGNMLIHPSPRIPHPPMDAILGVDFILQNFINKQDIRRLISTPEYRSILKNSQRRIWMPYMLSLAHHWCNFSCTNYFLETPQSKKLYPNLEY